jgi:RNA polymerase sigma factor (sigma-70 family)
MLKSPKKTELTQVQQTHVDLFVEHYEQLRRWALQFSEHDPERSEDLLHDFFLHFTITRPDLNTIENLEGYLYVVMRNLHLSQVRRATRTPLRALSVVDFDTVDVGFWASDPRDRIRMQDELGAVCQYACIRKESSKAGSVLILRFFHGYYPDEIAQVLCVTRPAVKERLRLARAEAKLYLEDPDRLSFIGDKPAKPAKFSVDPISGDLRLTLRRTIFNSRHGEHSSHETLNEFYKSENGTGPECGALAHIVSCASCLDEVNMLLEIPTLASRYPEDTIGKDPGRKGGSGGSGGAGGGRKMLDTYIRRSNELYYHEPQELCISVNGHLQGLQRVASEKSEMTLIIDMTENLGFVEVFSEQGIRLLMLNVEPPPAGDAKQTARVELSDGRTLDANLSFSGSFPALQVTYNDPALAVAAMEVSEVPNAESEPGAATGFLSVPPAETDGAFKKLRNTFATFLGSILQPARITAACAVLIIAALLLFKFGPVATVSAAELLNKSAESEAAQLANKDRVLHRTLDLEESKDGQVIARKRIDIWQSAERGITARRLYDEQGRLAMGDWRRADGIQTIYQRGIPAKLQPLPEKRGAAIGFDDAWQLSVSAKEFVAMLGDTTQAQVETRSNDYLISYTRVSSPPARGGVAPASSEEVVGDGVIKAAIVLSREDLHPIEQTFTLRYGDETRDYRMTEASYEWRPSNSVAPAVFEPNVELTGSTVRPSQVKTIDDLNANTGEPLANANTSSESTAANLATPALEVEVIDLLNKANAFMGEQVSVQRTSDGRIQISALVEAAQRKAELLNALASVKSNSAVRIKIETVAEVQAREAKNRKAGGTSGNMTVDQVQATENTSPVYNDLRKKFSDTEARAFADRSLRHGAQARRHALAMKQLSERFSLTDLQSLSAAERDRWLSLIRGHAQSYLSETDALKRELQAVFPDLGGGGSAAGGVGSDREIQASVRQLYDLSVACDEDLRSSFALFTNASAGAEVKTAKFWRALNNAAAVARSLEGAR